MAAEAIKIRATAAKLYKETGDERIEGYKTMPLDDLKQHIENIQKGTGASPAKGKGASANGAAAPSKGKGKPAASAPAKGKGKTATGSKGKNTARTSAPAKSTAQKSSPAKGKAAQGTAKRPTAAAGKGKATATKGKTTPAKGRTSAAPAKGKTSTTAKPATRRPKNAPTGRADIDNKAVDWKADWNGGKTGKRAEVMSALRKFKGDKAKVFTLLAPKARQFYKGRTKHEAERLLVWLIGRVAFDFVTATGQHEQGTRAAYGTASDPKNVRRRELREQRRKEAEKAERAAKRAQGKAPAKGGRGKATTAAKGKGRK